MSFKFFLFLLNFLAQKNNTSFLKTFLHYLNIRQQTGLNGKICFSTCWICITSANWKSDGKWKFNHVNFIIVNRILKNIFKFLHYFFHIYQYSYYICLSYNSITNILLFSLEKGWSLFCYKIRNFLTVLLYPTCHSFRNWLSLFFYDPFQKIWCGLLFIYYCLKAKKWLWPWGRSFND